MDLLGTEYLIAELWSPELRIDICTIILMFMVDIQWNRSVTTTDIIKSITCDLFSNVF